MKRSRFLKILALLVLLLFFNKILGEFLGLIGKCKVNWDAGNNVKIFTSCGGFTNKLIADTLKASAFTLDHIILTNDKTLTPDIYKHELAHTKQYSYLGPLFLPMYGIAHIASLVDAEVNRYQNPHAGNLFEIWADKMAGLQPETKIAR